MLGDGCQANELAGDEEDHCRHHKLQFVSVIFLDIIVDAA